MTFGDLSPTTLAAVAALMVLVWLLTIFLLRISGVPLLERRMSRTRAGYAEYAARTSSFVPLPPKRKDRS